VPVLICDLRPEAASLAAEYELLREAGESVALFWPQAPLPAGWAEAGDAAGMHTAWESGHIARVRAVAGLPLDEFERCLVIGERVADPGAPERACARALLAGGAEEVELLTPGAARELAQSWRSGRRTGSLILRA
jgi:hypothetical protein